MQVRDQLDEVQSGMSVYDIDGNRIGVVSYIHRGADNQDTNLVSLRDVKKLMQSLLGDTADFPLAVYARFYQDGFVRVSYGNFNLYFIPRQVDMVVGSQIHLRVAGEDLLTGNAI